MGGRDLAERDGDPVAGVEQRFGGEIAVGVGFEDVVGGDAVDAGEFGDADMVAEFDGGSGGDPGFAVDLAQLEIGVEAAQEFRALLGFFGQGDAVFDGDIAQPLALQGDDAAAEGERFVGRAVGVVLEQLVERDVLFVGDAAERLAGRRDEGGFGCDDRAEQLDGLDLRALVFEAGELGGQEVAGSNVNGEEDDRERDPEGEEGDQKATGDEASYFAGGGARLPQDRMRSSGSRAGGGRRHRAGRRRAR